MCESSETTVDNADDPTVRNFLDSLGTLKIKLAEEANSFQAGQIRNHRDQRELITEDVEILHLVDGASIDFSDYPFQEKPAKELHFSEQQLDAIRREIQEL